MVLCWVQEDEEGPKRIGFRLDRIGITACVRG